MWRLILINKNLKGAYLLSLLVSIIIGIILLQTLLYLFYITHKFYYRINTEINFIQDAEILKRHLSLDFQLNSPLICSAYSFMCAQHSPKIIQHKMKNGRLINGSSVIVISYNDQPKSLICYYLSKNKKSIMRYESSKKTPLAIIANVQAFNITQIDTYKYQLELNLSDSKEVNMHLSKKIFIHHAAQT